MERQTQSSNNIIIATVRNHKHTALKNFSNFSTRHSEGMQLFTPTHLCVGILVGSASQSLGPPNITQQHNITHEVYTNAHIQYIRMELNQY